jgi:hypothetical protein
MKIQGLSLYDEWDVINIYQAVKMPVEAISGGMAFFSSTSSRYPACTYSGSIHMVLECRRIIPDNKREAIPARYPPDRRAPDRPARESERPVAGKGGRSRFPNTLNGLKKDMTHNVSKGESYG